MMEYLKRLLLLVFLVLISSFAVNASFCYQETANVSTACGGFSSGGYDGGIGSWHNHGRFFDGDWSNYARLSLNDNFLNATINYTKPAFALSTSLWEVKYTDELIHENYSIPATCWSQTPLQLMVLGHRGGGTPGNLSGRCWNGSSWNNIFNSSYGSQNHFLYEEAVWWDDVINLSISNVNDTDIVNCSWDTNLSGTDLSGVNWFVNDVKLSLNTSPMNNITPDGNDFKVWTRNDVLMTNKDDIAIISSDYSQMASDDGTYGASIGCDQSNGQIQPATRFELDLNRSISSASFEWDGAFYPDGSCWGSSASWEAYAWNFTSGAWVQMDNGSLNDSAWNYVTTKFDISKNEFIDGGEIQVLVRDACYGEYYMKTDYVHYNATFDNGTLETDYFGTYDNVVCEVTPRNASHNGTSKNSSAVNITNTPPTLKNYWAYNYTSIFAGVIRFGSNFSDDDTIGKVDIQLNSSNSSCINFSFNNIPYNGEGWYAKNLTTNSSFTRCDYVYHTNASDIYGGTRKSAYRGRSVNITVKDYSNVINTTLQHDYPEVVLANQNHSLNYTKTIVLINGNIASQTVSWNWTFPSYVTTDTIGLRNSTGGVVSYDYNTTTRVFNFSRTVAVNSTEMYNLSYNLSAITTSIVNSTCSGGSTGVCTVYMNVTNNHNYKLDDVKVKIETGDIPYYDDDISSVLVYWNLVSGTGLGDYEKGYYTNTASTSVSHTYNNLEWYAPSATQTACVGQSYGIAEEGGGGGSNPTTGSDNFINSTSNNSVSYTADTTNESTNAVSSSDYTLGSVLTTQDMGASSTYQLKMIYNYDNREPQPPIYVEVGGGGGEVIDLGVAQRNCSVIITPMEVFLDDDNLIQEILITNTDNISYSPEVSFMDVRGEDSVVSRVQLTNVIGTVLAGEDKVFGVQYRSSVFGSVPAKGVAGLVLSSELCENETILVSMDVRSTNWFSTLVEGEGSASERVSNLARTDVIEGKAGWFEVWIILALMALLWVGLFWSGRWSDSDTLNILTKVGAWLITVPVTTGILVVIIRTIWGLL